MIISLFFSPVIVNMDVPSLTVEVVISISSVYVSESESVTRLIISLSFTISSAWVMFVGFSLVLTFPVPSLVT
jgi:hypothetical protein